MLNGLFNRFKKTQEKEIEPISSILKIKTAEENLFFIIPNISCISDIQENDFEEWKTYMFEIYTRDNKVQISVDSKTKAINRHKKIIELIEQWWLENG